MLLQPRKMKYRKWQKGRSKGVSIRGSKLNFGSFGLKSLGTRWIKATQIESARVAINRALKKKGELWVRIFPYKPITTKGAEVPMGGGKGNVDHYVFPIKPGRIIFEVDGVKEEIAKEALRKGADKLAVKTKFVKREA